VLELMATGASYREIAARLVVGETTVKSHVHTILRKLGAVSRADAVSRHLRREADGG
jgi:DNA-binding NarL/FixJ family response regulator